MKYTFHFIILSIEGEDKYPPPYLPLFYKGGPMHEKLGKNSRRILNVFPIFKFFVFIRKSWATKTNVPRGQREKDIQDI